METVVILHLFLPTRLVLRLLIAVTPVIILVRNLLVVLVGLGMLFRPIKPVLLLLTTVEHVTKIAMLLTVVRVDIMLRYLRTIFVLQFLTTDKLVTITVINHNALRGDI